MDGESQSTLQDDDDEDEEETSAMIKVWYILIYCGNVENMCYSYATLTIILNHIHVWIERNR